MVFAALRRVAQHDPLLLANGVNLAEAEAGFDGLNPSPLWDSAPVVWSMRFGAATARIPSLSRSAAFDGHAPTLRDGRRCGAVVLLVVALALFVRDVPALTTDSGGVHPAVSHAQFVAHGALGVDAATLTRSLDRGGARSAEPAVQADSLRERPVDAPWAKLPATQWVPPPRSLPTARARAP